MEKPTATNRSGASARMAAAMLSMSSPRLRSVAASGPNGARSSAMASHRVASAMKPGMSSRVMNRSISLPGDRRDAGGYEAHLTSSLRVRASMPTFSFDAQVTAALFDKTGAIFALGDGSVRFETGARSEVHDGAVLCACGHPSGEGIVTGGDDGKVVWSREGEAVLLAQTKGAWVDSIAASPESGLIAFSAGRTLT